MRRFLIHNSGFRDLLAQFPELQFQVLDAVFQCVDLIGLLRDDAIQGFDGVLLFAK